MGTTSKECAESMAVEAKKRERAQGERTLDLPPPYALVTLREVGGDCRSMQTGAMLG